MTPTIYPPAPSPDEMIRGPRARLDLVVRMLELAQRPSEHQTLYLAVALEAARALRDAAGLTEPTPYYGKATARPAAGAPVRRAERPPTRG
jgi:hypothetical protein